MNKALLWVCLIFFASIHCFAQNNFEIKETGYQTDTFYKSVVSTNDGGYATKEIVYESNAPHYSIIVNKFNSCSNLVWSKKIIAKANKDTIRLWQEAVLKIQYSFYVPYLTSIAGTDSGGVLLAYTNFNPNEDIIADKLDNKGNILWAKKVNTGKEHRIIQELYCTNTKSNGFIIMGLIDSVYLDSNFQLTQSPAVCFATGIRNNGTKEWSKNYSFPNTYNFQSNIVTKALSLSDGGYIILAYNFGGIMRTDSMGNVLWTIFTDGTLSANRAYVTITGIDMDNYDSIYCYGNYGYVSNGTGKVLAGLFKINKNGKLLWCSTYGVSTALQELEPLNIQTLSNNHILTYNHPGTGLPSTIILETDQTGNLLKSIILPDIKVGLNGNLDATSSSATLDSGSLLIGISSDGYTLLSKVNTNLDEACNRTDISYGSNKVNLAFSNLFIDTFPGYAITDTIVITYPLSNKILLVCSDGHILNANLGNDTVLCSAASYTLHKGAQNAGAKTYWSTGDTTDSIVVTHSGKYWLQLSHGYCTSSDTVRVIFKFEIFTGLPDKIFTCIYDSGWIYPQDTIANYYWIKPDKDTVQGRGVYLNDSGYYYLRLNGTKSCAAMDTLHIAYWTLPDASAGPDTTLCYNETYTMQGSGGITYTWHPAVYLSSSTDPKAIAQLPNTERYELIVRNAQGCIDSSPVLLKVRPPLKPKAMVNNASVCYGQTIILSAKATGGDSLHYQFNWTPDNLSGDSISEKVYQSGWHKITLSDNCSAQNATDSVYVTVTPPVKASFTNIPATKIKANHNISFINQSTNASSYLWTFGTKDSSRLVSPVYVYTDTGDYQVILVAYGINNCTNDTAYGFIKIISDQITIYIPNAFSPNGDGINDVFDISGVGIKSYSYNIYNRWGENIYNGTAAWDGNFKSGQVPDGVYIYMFDITDVFGEHHYLNGNVTLMR